MSEFEQLQKLIRLKRHEGPQDMQSFTDDLIANLHARQRGDLLKLSWTDLLRERLEMWFMFASKPQLAAVTVTAMVLMLGAVAMLLPHRSSSRERVEVVLSGAQSDISPLIGLDLMPLSEEKEINPTLLSTHFDGSYPDEKRSLENLERLQNRKERFESMPTFKFADEIQSAGTPRE